MNARLGIAALASLVLHAAMFMTAPTRTTEVPRPATLVPLDLTAEAPPPPKPPEPSEPPPQPAKPKPRPQRKPRPKPPDVSAGTLPVPDAGVSAETLPADAGFEPDAAVTPDAGTETPPFDPAVADLRHIAPPGEKVVVVVRTDRLRGTPWAEAVQAILTPLPDYRRLFEGTGLSLADTFDLFVIASSDPRQITQTFLAGKTTVDVKALFAARKGDDPRVLIEPEPGWLVFIRPELAEKAAWQDDLLHVSEETRDDKLLAVVTVGDLPAPGMQAPKRVTVAIRLDPNGFTVTGSAVFADTAGAQAFRTAVAETKTNIGRRFILRAIGLFGAMQRLQLAGEKERVTFSTSLTNAEGLFVLDQAAEMARKAFPSGP